MTGGAGVGGAIPKPEYSDAELGHELLFHDIQQTLRITGVDQLLRLWPGNPPTIESIWSAVKPNAETRAFENMADHIRRLAVGYAKRLGHLDAAPQASLGESQSWHVRAALDLYHYLNPKLLLLSSAIRLALLVEGPPGLPRGTPRRIQRGVPVRMYPMEILPDGWIVSDVPGVIEEIKTELDTRAAPSCYRTLALWPSYLRAAWEQLKPLIRRLEYEYACDRLREESRATAITLPCRINLTTDQLRAAGEDPDAVLHTIEEAERILPSLILNIALMALDWKPHQELSASPFPVGER